jgi:hypothetical protein
MKRQIKSVKEARESLEAAIQELSATEFNAVQGGVTAVPIFNPPIIVVPPIVRPPIVIP